MEGYWYCPYCNVEVDPQNVTYQELHDTCGHSVHFVEINKPSYEQLQAERDSYRELTEWFINLAMGCGKAGGRPESGEWDDCVVQAQQALKEADNEGD